MLVGPNELSRDWYSYHETDDNVLASANPVGEVVLLLKNDLCVPQNISVMLSAEVVNISLPADSLSMVLIPAK